MVEMAETSHILKNATLSAVLLDEIDGAPARACYRVGRYRISAPTGGARTLFATHYHELTSLESG